MVLRSILIIADDLTGAADTAGQFRQAGFAAIVLAHPTNHHSAWPRAQVMSLSLNSRDASTATVRHIWERQGPTIRALAQDALVYHKIDSTLRGHPGLEVRLLRDCLGASTAIVAPAFPKLGRSTIDGVHRVDGLPLAETEYHQPRRRSQPTSYLPELLAGGDETRPIHLPWQIIEAGVERVVRWLHERIAESCRLITADAADERHLDILTQAVLPLAGRVLLVGSAGWAERLAMTCKGLISEARVAPGALGIVGSLSASATRQVHVAAHAGVTVVSGPSPTRHAPSGDIAREWQAIVPILVAGRSVILWTNAGGEHATSHSAGGQVLRAAASIARQVLCTTSVSGLMVVGGDTARTVFRALQADGMVLIGEVAPGVPYGRLLNGPFAGLPTATKAGGFGADTAIEECLKFLKRAAVQ